MSRQKKPAQPVAPLAQSWTVDRSDLLRALKLASTIVKGSGKIPYLEHVLLTGTDGTALTLAATNGDETVSTTLEGEVIGARAFCVPWKLFYKIVSVDPSERLTLSAVDGRPFSLHLRGADGSSTISGLDPADFPTLPSALEVKEWGELPLQELAAALYRSRHAAGDGGRFHLNAALLQQDGDDLVLYATDGHRMWRERMTDSGATLPEGSEGGLSISTSTFEAISATEGVLVRVGWSAERRHLLLLTEDGGTMLAFRRSEAQHPNYEAILRSAVKGDFTYTVDRLALEAAVKRAQVTANGERVQILHAPGSLVVQTESQEGKTLVTVPDDTEGSEPPQEWRVQLNGDYLLQALAAVEAGIVTLLIAEEGAHASLTVQPFDPDPENGPRVQDARLALIMRQEWGK